MGTSTNAYLFFGILIDEYDESFEELKNDWEEKYAAKVGLVDDSGLWNDDGEYAIPEGIERKNAEENWKVFLKRKQDLIEELGITIDSHCHREYPEYFVCISDSFISATRGNPEVIKFDELKKTEDINKLKDFCELMGLKYKEPKWYLASFWG